MDKQYFFQAGLVSAGIGCGLEGIPGIYSNVTSASCFIDWATKCHLGESNVDYGFECNWGQKKLCELKRDLETYKVSFIKYNK